MVINQNASFFQAGRCTHRHTAAVLDAIGLSSWTATNQSHAAAPVTPLRDGSWFWHCKLPGLCNQPKGNCAGKGVCWCGDRAQAFWLSRQSSLTFSPDSTARSRLTSSNTSVVASSPFSCHSRLRGSNNSGTGTLSFDRVIGLALACKTLWS